MAKTPLTQGYVVFSSDGGHQAPPENYWDCRWALNDESLENFAHAALKKVRDVVYYLAERFYGTKPQYVYFAGGSNGGRECMKAIQNYAGDYDGAICFYPVLYWVLKVLLDHRNGNALSDSGEEAWIDAGTYREVMRIIMDECDHLDGARDNVIGNIAAVWNDTVF